MNKLRAFIRLDFSTVKPYLNIKTLLILGVFTIFVSVLNGTVSMFLGTGFMLGMIFGANPFAIGEKCSLDALYITLGISKRTVVLGRYLFVLLFDIASILFAFVLSAFGVFGAKALGILQDSGGTSVAATILIPVVLLLMQMFQLSRLFKTSYSKAKFVFVLPILMVTASMSFIRILANNTATAARLSSALPESFAGKVLFGAVIAAMLALAALCSYRRSIAIYKKRDF
ncbi:MAG: ABC-2 transporter permease [Oscillospiraceae bacterium]|jgi:hypothetical protein|nr:ABC-2 transporter permease [Oscillospiraceae bacterium]